MATASVQITDRAPAIGRVFSRAFAVMAHNPLVAFGISLVLSALPSILFNYVTVNQQTLLPENSNLALMTVVSALLAVLVGLVLRALVQGCLVRATVADSEGRRAGLGECLGAAASRLLPLIAVSLLFALAIVVGLVMLIIPGILLAVIYAVVIPVIVEERVGIIEAFRRAGHLSNGARWKIFGLALITLIIGWFFAMIMGVVQVAMLGAGGYNPFSPAVLLVSAITTTLMTTFSSTMQTALYVELREWKDGPATDRLSEVFE